MGGESAALRGLQRRGGAGRTHELWQLLRHARQAGPHEQILDLVDANAGAGDSTLSSWRGRFFLRVQPLDSPYPMTRRGSGTKKAEQEATVSPRGWLARTGARGGRFCIPANMGFTRGGLPRGVSQVLSS